MRVSWIIFTALCTVVLLLSLCAGTVCFAKWVWGVANLWAAGDGRCARSASGIESK